MPAVQVSAQDTAYQASIHHPSILKRMKDICRISNDLINNGNTEQDFRAEVTKDKAPDDQTENLIRIQLQLLRPALSSEVSSNNTDSYHQSIAVDGKRSDGKQFVLHILIPFPVQNIRCANGFFRLPDRAGA